MTSYYLARRTLADGREVTVIPLTFGRARITIGPPLETGVYDDGW